LRAAHARTRPSRDADTTPFESAEMWKPMRWLVSAARGSRANSVPVRRTSHTMMSSSRRAAVSSRRPSSEKLACVTPPRWPPSSVTNPGAFSAYSPVVPANDPAA
jgi:hypothetical protein